MHVRIIKQSSEAHIVALFQNRALIISRSHFSIILLSLVQMSWPTTMLIWFISVLTNGQNLPHGGFGVFCAPLFIVKAQHVISLRLSRRPVCVSDLCHTHTFPLSCWRTWIYLSVLKNSRYMCTMNLLFILFHLSLGLFITLFILWSQLCSYLTALNHSVSGLLGPLPTPRGFSVIYTCLVLEQMGRLFFCLIDCCDQFLFSSPFLFCRCRAEIVIEHIDRSAVGSIDRQGQSPGQWKMALPSSLQHLSGGSFLFLNLSLISSLRAFRIIPASVSILPLPLISKVFRAEMDGEESRYRACRQSTLHVRVQTLSWHHAVKMKQ